MPFNLSSPITGANTFVNTRGDVVNPKRENFVLITFSSYTETQEFCDRGESVHGNKHLLGLRDTSLSLGCTPLDTDSSVSILNEGLSIRRFIGFKFRIGRRSPVFFGTRKYIE